MGMAPDARRYAQAIVDALELPSALLGPSGELWVANGAWQAPDGPPLAGPALGDVGDSFRTGLDEIDGPLRHPAAQLARAIDAALDGSVTQPRVLTYRVRQSEHKVRWWRTEVRPADIEPRCVVLSHRDVTSQRKTEEELRRSQARLRTIVTGAPIVLFALDDEGHFTLVEGMGAVGAAFASPDLVGQSVFDAYAQMPDLLEIVREALSGRVAVSTIEVGSLAYEVRCSPYASHDGTRDGVVGVATDVTERLKAQRMKDEFVSIVSHELRTPLTSIRGSLGLLEGGVAGELPQKARDLTRIARTNTDRLIRLINDILDLEKMESGRLELRRKTTPLGRIALDVSGELGPLATQAGVTLDVQTAEDDAVHIDRDRIHQVVTNLLSNAIKFSPDGGVVVIDIEPANAGRIRLSVRDQGPGIAARDLPRLFKKFSQLDSSTRRTKMGSGLGLVISKSIVDAHGGRIWVESEVGVGSTFMVELPRPVTETRAKPRPRATPTGQRRETLAMDSGALGRRALSDPKERLAALRRLFGPPSGISTQAALDDAHANLNILSSVLSPGPGAALAHGLRADVEVALRELAAGRPVDWHALETKLDALERAANHG
ncbi:MAG: ATP-binding protein [Nannocystaceae bacterium]|nr:ATP-binding protein [bacterium]